MKRIILLNCALLIASYTYAQNSLQSVSVADLELQEILKKSQTKIPQITTDIQELTFPAVPPVVDGDGQATRALSEINHEERVDAYPWLSADGLRIYYTANADEGIDDKLFMASRNSTDDAFENITELDVNLEGEANVSCWLTNDELEIYFMVRKSDGEKRFTSIFYAYRSSKTSLFSEPVQVQLNGDFSGYLSSPSLTQDKSQLYIYNANGEKRRILIFEQNGENNYDLESQIVVPKDYKIGSGQISKDGLSYTLSINTDNLFKLYTLTRKTFQDEFENLTELNSDINGETFHNIHPSFSADGSIVAFVRCDANDWSRNDLYIGHLSIKPKKSDVLDVATHLEAYPNPTANNLTIENKESDFDKIQIFSIDGRLILEKILPAETSKVNLDVSFMNTGVYVCKVSSGDEWVESIKFVVKK